MKILLITIFTSLLSITACCAQNVYTFNIDTKPYRIEETALNELFGKAFNDLTEQKWASEQYFYLWSQSFENWKGPALRGTFNYTTYGDRIGNLSFSGEIFYEYLGYEKPGKSAKGDPNKKKNTARRLGLLSYALAKQIIQYSTGKTIIN